MDVSVADSGHLRKTVTLTYSKDEIKAREEQKIAQYATQINLKGFRKGKTPRSLVKKRFGQAIENEIADELIQNGMRQAMQDNDLEPLGPFSDEDRKLDGGLTYVTSFNVKPEVKLPAFDSIEITNEDIDVTDEELQSELDNFAQRAGETKELEAGEKLAAEDSVTLSGKITSGDEVVREIQDLNHLIGSYPLFGKEADEVSALAEKIGVGEALEFDTTLPERFKPEEWAEKEAHVSVTIQSATRRSPAEIDDELAKKLGVEDLETLKDHLKGSIEQRKQQDVRQKQVEEMIDGFIAQTDFELPEALLEQMLNDNLQGAEQAKAQNPSAPDVDKDEITKNTERVLRRHLIIDTIIRDNDIQASKADLDQQLMMAAWQSGRKAEEIEKELYENGQIQQVLHEIVEGKAIEFALTQIIGEEETEDDNAAEEASTEAESAEAKTENAEA